MPASTFAPPHTITVWLSTKEAASLIGVSRYTLEARIRKGVLKAHRPTPRTTRISLDSIKEMLAPDIRAALPESLSGAAARKALGQLLGRAVLAGGVV